MLRRKKSLLTQSKADLIELEAWAVDNKMRWVRTDKLIIWRTDKEGGVPVKRVVCERETTLGTLPQHTLCQTAKEMVAVIKAEVPKWAKQIKGIAFKKSKVVSGWQCLSVEVQIKKGKARDIEAALGLEVACAKGWLLGLPKRWGAK